MAVNKVIYSGKTVIDLTSDSVTADSLLYGTTAHDKSGTRITGTIQRFAVEDETLKQAVIMTVSGETLNVTGAYITNETLNL